MANLPGRKPRQLADRIAERLTRNEATGCLEWTGARCRHGYGRIRVGSAADGSRRGTSTHRVAWELAHGPIPDGLCVLHRCDNPPCCEPTHLFLGTQLDNAADRDAKGRLRVPRNSGERSGRAKLTQAKVDEIRRRYAVGGVSMAGLAAEFGVASSTVEAIISGRTWAGQR